MQRIGYNIACEHAGSDRQAAADAQVNARSTVTLLLDDHKSDWFFSKQIAARSPETLRIARTFMQRDAQTGWDGNLNEAPDGNSPTGYLSPENYLNYLQNLNAPTGTIHQVMCEPAMHGERLSRKVEWLCEVIKEASRRGVRLCVDNIQTVVLEGDDLERCNPLWFTLAAHPEHFYGVHAYWLGDGWFNTSDVALDMLTSTVAVGVRFLQNSVEDLRAAYIRHASEAHIGREDLIAARCRQIGAPVPRMVYTEIGADLVRLEQYQAVKYINGGREPMGYPTLWNYWARRYPQWTPAKTYVMMCDWLNKSMPDYIIGACLFGKDTAFENGQYHLDAGFDLELAKWSQPVSASPEPPQPPPVVTLPPTIPPRVPSLEERVTALEQWRAQVEGDL